jgi:hypothetical protein
MVANTLAEDSKSAREWGWRLLEYLRHRQDVTLVGLFWAPFDDVEWRLFIAVEYTAVLGPREVRDILRSFLPSEAEAEDSDDYLLTIADTVVVGPHDHSVREARRWAAARYGDQSVEPFRDVVRRASLGWGETHIYYLAPEK